jgi:peptide subunit release factor 1 (eRF1)
LSPSKPAGAAATAVGAPVGTIAKPANELSRKMIADALVSLARKSGTAITFIEDRRLLADVGGIGAFLRYKI